MKLLAWNGGGIAELDKIFKPKDPKKTTSTSGFIEELEGLVEGEVKAIFDKVKVSFEEL